MCTNKNVKKLYRYLKFDCEKLGEILIQNKLYFYPPNILNDPFDSKIQFTYQGCTDDDFRYFLRSYITNSEPKSKHGEIKKRVEEIISRNLHRSPEWQKKFRDHAKKILQPDIDKAGLLCLTEESEDILMWSHYGDGHKGLCLEFDNQLLDSCFICRKVSYDKDNRYHSVIEFYKKVGAAMGNANNNTHNAHEEIAALIFFRKAKHWDYEREWRILIPWQDVEKHNGGRYFSYPERMLTGIILGCNIDDAQQSIIEMMISNRSTKPTLFRAHKNDDEFKLDIRELNNQTLK